jgi:3'-5' exoribonuclease
MANSFTSQNSAVLVKLPAVDQPAAGTAPGTSLIKVPTSAVATIPMPQPLAANVHPFVLPPILRIESIEVTPVPTKTTLRVTAVLFHESASLRVTWVTRHPDTRLRRGSLVEMKRAQQDVNDGAGALVIDRLILVEMADAVTNLFKTIPYSWVQDRRLVAQAAALWEFLPRPLAHLMNAVFWDGDRFLRYVRCPSSTGHHHSRRHGNLEHSADVVERALGMAGRISKDQVSLLIFGGLMHDAGKADEYEPKTKEENYRRTRRGVMVGHKQTLIEWLAVARQTGRVILSEEQYLLILNMLTSNPHAPDYLGIPKPVSELAGILSAADRVSGESDNFTRHAPTSEQGGFGQYQKHIRRASYKLSANDAEGLQHRQAANDPEFGVELSLTDRLFKGCSATLRAVRQAANEIWRKRNRATTT